MRYTTPKYEREMIETSDVMNGSMDIIVIPSSGAVLTEETDTLAKVAVSVKNLFKFSE